MRVGSATPAAYRLGSTAVSALYLGATSVWTSAPFTATIGAVDDVTDIITVTVSHAGTLYWRRQATDTNPAAATIVAGGGFDAGSFAISAGTVNEDITFATGNDGLQQISITLDPTADPGNYSTPSHAAITIDTVDPAFPTLSPIDGAADVAVDANLVMTFSESMARQGTVTLKNVGDADIETFDLSADGTWSTTTSTDDTWTGNPTADFANSATLAVQWSGLEDVAGNTLADNATDTLWDFGVVAAGATATNAPTIGSTSVVLDFASEEITGVANGGAVSSWPDRSGNAINASNLTGSGITWEDANTPTGKPAVKFTGVGGLKTDYSATYQVTRPSMYFLVAVDDYDFAASQNIAGVPFAVDQHIAPWFEYTISSSQGSIAGKLDVNTRWNGNGDAAEQTNQYDELTWVVLAMSNRIIYLNGTQILWQTGSDIIYENNASFHIGMNGAGGSPLFGRIARLLIYDGIHSAANVATVTTFLQNEYLTV